MGFNTLAANSGVSIDEAKRIHKVMFDEFYELREYTDELFKYPLDHDGHIRTFYGDNLVTPAWRFIYDPVTGKQDTGTLAKASRHGCNYCIQNGSAITLAAGFWNNIRVARQHGIVMSPLIVVHDSNTNYVPAGFMPHLRAFYDENFTKFTREFTGVPFLYDLFVGANYNDCCLLNTINEHKISIGGSNSDILKILGKLDDARVDYAINIDRRDLIPEYVENPIERFIRDSINTNIEMDISENNV